MALGLIAGMGPLPLEFAKAAASMGEEVFAVAFRGYTDPALEGHVAGIAWLGVGEAAGIVPALKGAGCRRAVTAGRIPQEVVLGGAPLDGLARRIVAGAATRQTQAVLRAGARYLARHGVKLLDARTYLRPLLIGRGLHTSRPVSEAEWEDIRYGARIAKAIGALDIGQTVVVRAKAVVAVEALEGTDACIERAGRLLPGEKVVVKVSKRRQDMRFDIPVIGPGTVGRLAEAGGGVLAAEAGRTFLLERERTLQEAERLGISVVGF